jgi:hypothetical protein
LKQSGIHTPQVLAQILLLTIPIRIGADKVREPTDVNSVDAVLEAASIEIGGESLKFAAPFGVLSYSETEISHALFRKDLTANL